MNNTFTYYSPVDFRTLFDEHGGFTDVPAIGVDIKELEKAIKVLENLAIAKEKYIRQYNFERFVEERGLILRDLLSNPPHYKKTGEVIRKFVEETALYFKDK